MKIFETFSFLLLISRRFNSQEVIKVGKSQDRLFEALNYGKGEKAKLTAKQYLVYSYLISISKWDAQDKERHYYVYKNSFLIKDACAKINISQPTWRSAIKKLKEFYYIFEYDKYYTIEIPNTYAPLNINLIRYLLDFGAVIKNGGNIVSVYSIIYKYWKYCGNDECEITINQLRKLFNSKTDKEVLKSYRLMLGLFKDQELMDIEYIGRHYQGKPYRAYIIKNVNLTLPETIKYSDENSPDNIEYILESLEQRYDCE